MAIVLLAVLLALIAGHVLPDLARLRDFGWFDSWLRAGSGWFGESRFWQGGAGALFSVGVPVAVLGLVQFAFIDALYGLAHLVLGAIVLFYCWGPRDLDLDVDAIVSAPDMERRQAALQALPPDPPEPPLQLAGATVVDHTFRAALSRWFGVLFWFIALGPLGALLYRLTQLAARAKRFREPLPAAQAEALEHFAKILDWPAAQLMTLALALSADFDAVLTAWRDFHAARGKKLVLDAGFLLAAGRASVEIEEDLGEGYGEDARGPIAELQQAMALNWRILIVWLVVFSLLVLAGSIR